MYTEINPNLSKTFVYHSFNDQQVTRCEVFTVECGIYGRMWHLR